MVMVGHERRLQQPLRWGRRERWAIGAVVAILCAAVIALILGTTLGASSSAGCIDATFASTTGGAGLHACGARARSICSGISASSSRDNASTAVAQACRRAGYPIGR